MIDLSIITVTHQSADCIEDCILSVISGALKIATEHFIVDNASTDATVALIENSCSSFVTLIKNEKNLGFSAANNQAVVHARGRYVLFLNPDMKVEEGSLDRIVEWIEGRSDVGIAGCKLIDPLGTLLVRRSPFFFPRLKESLCWLVCLIFCEKHYEWRHTCLEEKQVDVVIGAFMLVRKELIDQLGYAFDPRYFLTYEDTDLCKEAADLGYKVMYYPKIRCIDYGSLSFKKKNGLWIYRQLARGMYLYFRKWEPWYAWMCVALCIPVGYIVRYLLVKIASNKKEIL